MPQAKQKRVQLAVRISQDVHRAAKASASMKGISLADFVEGALFRALLAEPKVINVTRTDAELGKRGVPALEVKPRARGGK